MSIASKYNHGQVYNYVMPEGAEFRGLEDLYKEHDANTIFPVYGFFINRKGMYGDNPVALSNGFFISLPEHLLKDVQEIMADPEATEQINGGGLGLQIRSYEKEIQGKGGRTSKRVCYSVTWVDC